MDTITKTRVLEARKILKEYERQRNAEKRARQCVLPCTAIVYEFLKRKNDGFGHEVRKEDA